MAAHAASHQGDIKKGTQPMAKDKLKLDQQICFRLYTASRLITQVYEPFLASLGITYTQYLVMLVLWEKDEQPVNDIGKRLHLGINTMSPLIKRMEKLGLISRRENPDDKRQQIVFLTPEGRAMRNKATMVPDGLAEELQANNVPIEEVQAIAATLDNLIDHLTAKQERGE